MSADGNLTSQNQADKLNQVRIVKQKLRKEGAQEIRTVGESHEIRLVERIHYLHGTALDDFVFQRSHAQRSLLSAWFWNKHSSYGLCPVSTPPRTRPDFASAYQQWI